MKLAMIGVHRALAESGLKARMILTIHDELLLEGPPEEMDAARELVEREMVAPWGDRTPPLAVDAGVGANWTEAK
jgi:DNA polymerase-1